MPLAMSIAHPISVCTGRALRGSEHPCICMHASVSLCTDSRGHASPAAPALAAFRVATAQTHSFLTRSSKQPSINSSTIASCEGTTNHTLWVSTAKPICDSSGRDWEIAENR